MEFEELALKKNNFVTENACGAEPPSVQPARALHFFNRRLQFGVRSAAVGIFMCSTRVGPGAGGSCVGGSAGIAGSE